MPQPTWRRPPLAGIPSFFLALPSLSQPIPWWPCHAYLSSYQLRPQPRVSAELQAAHPGAPGHLRAPRLEAKPPEGAEVTSGMGVHMSHGVLSAELLTAAGHGCDMGRVS